MHKLRSDSHARSRIVRRIVPALTLAAILCALSSLAAAQDFTLDMGRFSPFAIAPGQTAASNITFTPLNGFTGSVALTCVVTTNQIDATLPECQMSPPTVTPPGGANATVITTFGDSVATPGPYTVTVTGTSSTDGTTVSSSQAITVLAVSGQFSITVTSPIAPTSVPAGSGSEATITVTGVNGYSGNVTLACATVTPLVAYPPQCVFAYPQNATSVPVSDGSPGSVTLTINTFSTNTPITSNAHSRAFYALWLPLPLVVFAGVGAAIGGRRSRRFWSLLALLVLSAGLLLLPACNNTTYSTPSGNSAGTTANGTYTFTLVGIDTKGNVSSNTGTGSTAPTVELTVTSATN